MTRNQRGFTLVELMVAIPVVLLVLYASSQILVANVVQFKQQTRIAEAGLESNIGLRILRRDLHHAGFGLPDYVPSTVNYTETPVTLLPAANYNDGAVSKVPRLAVGGDSSGFGGSDYLVIRSLCVTDNRATGGRYHLQDLTGVTNEWPAADRNLLSGHRVIVLKVDPDDGEHLVVSSVDDTIFSTTYGLIDDFKPPDIETTNLIYGVSDTSDVSFPFNRADYYVTTQTLPYNSGAVVPSKCAANTGVLVKAVLNHVNRQLDTNGDNNFDSNDELPLVDCVADFQVVFSLDMDEDGAVGTLSNAEGTSIATVGAGEVTSTLEVQNTLAGATDVKGALRLRERLKEIMIYVLAHEGQMDPAFTFIPPGGPTTSEITVGPSDSLGRNFNLNTITDWKNYRWRLYRIVERPEALL